MEYASGMRYVLDSRGNSQTSGFSLSNNDFSGVMEGVNNDEYVFFDCERVTKALAPNKNNSTRSFGSAKEQKRVKSEAPLKLRVRN